MGGLPGVCGPPAILLGVLEGAGEDEVADVAGLMGLGLMLDAAAGEMAAGPGAR